MLLVGLLDLPSELCDQFQETDLEEAVEEGLVSLEVGDDYIFVEEVVEGFLFDGAVSYFCRFEGVGAVSYTHLTLPTIYSV